MRKVILWLFLSLLLLCGCGESDSEFGKTLHVTVGNSEEYTFPLVSYSTITIAGGNTIRYNVKDNEVDTVKVESSGVVVFLDSKSKPLFVASNFVIKVE